MLLILREKILFWTRIRTRVSSCTRWRSNQVSYPDESLGQARTFLLCLLLNCHNANLYFVSDAVSCNMYSPTTLLEKVSDPLFFATLRRREFFPSADGKLHLSELVFSVLVEFSLYNTSTHHRVEQSPKSTTGMSSVAYVMLCGARDRSLWSTVNWRLLHDNLQHSPRPLFRFFWRKLYSCGTSGSLFS